MRYFLHTNTSEQYHNMASRVKHNAYISFYCLERLQLTTALHKVDAHRKKCTKNTHELQTKENFLLSASDNEFIVKST